VGLSETPVPSRATPATASDGKVHLSVVVPVYNEQSILMQMAEELAPHLDEIAGPLRWQFVLVDNGSRDRSPEICDQIVSRWPESIKVELAQPNYGEALYQGLMRAAGPWAFIINVDFWDVPFMRWCFRTRGTYDMVMGSKRADEVLNRQSQYRRNLSWGLNIILQTVFNFPGTDTHGQKFIYLPTLRPIFGQCVMRRGQFDTEFTLRAARAKLWLAEVPVPIVELRKARNLMLHKIGRNIVDIWRLREVMRSNRSRTAMRYHRWSREDVEQLDDAQTALIVEMGRLHRGDVVPLDSASSPLGLSVQNQGSAVGSRAAAGQR
jgi:glycosyltransferase involved in cell wall biosynthesis